MVPQTPLWWHWLFTCIKTVQELQVIKYVGAWFVNVSFNTILWVFRMHITESIKTCCQTFVSLLLDGVALLLVALKFMNTYTIMVLLRCVCLWSSFVEYFDGHLSSFSSLLFTKWYISLLMVVGLLFYYIFKCMVFAVKAAFSHYLCCIIIYPGLAVTFMGLRWKKCSNKIGLLSCSSLFGRQTKIGNSTCYWSFGLIFCGGAHL